MIKLSRQKVTFVLITAVIIIGLMLLAGTLSQVELSQGNTYNLLALLGGGLDSPITAAGPATDINPIFILFTFLFWAGLAAAIIYAVISPQYRRRALLILLLVILLFYLANRIVLEQADRVVEDASGSALDFGDMGSASTALPAPPAYVTDPPRWIIWLVSGGVALLLAGVGFYIWQKRRQPDPRQQFVYEAEQALQELDAGADIKDVVMCCYVQMEGVMRQSQEVARKESMTPREFQRQLAKAGFRDEHISRLVRLFEEVRYGGHSANGRYEQEARDCLSAIVASYG